MHQQKMLLVDDQNSFRTSAAKMFSKRGFHIDTAANLIEAKDRGAAQRYSFAIIDLKFSGPDGVEIATDGIEIAKELRQQQPDLPFYYLSGFDENEFRKKAAKYQLEPIEWMRKPLTNRVLDPFCASALHKVVEARFYLLCGLWREETQYSSSLTDVVTSPAYQSIIGMGPVAVPLIISELKRRPELWFWALTAITGENPVTSTQRGRLDQMTTVWLEWADRNVKG